MKQYQKACAVLLLLVMSLLSIGLPPVAAEDETNVFQNAIIEASIANIAAIIAPGNMVDGDISISSRYASLTGQTVPLEVTISLDGTYDINRIKIHDRRLQAKGKACADNVKIELGEETAWGTVWRSVCENGKLTEKTLTTDEAIVATEFTFAQTTCKRAKITFSSNGATQYEFCEIEGFGTPNPSGGSTYENVAQGSAVTASLSPIASAFAAENLIDGDFNTRYASANPPVKKLVVTLQLPQRSSFDYIGIRERWVTKTCSDATSVDVGIKTENTVLWQRVIENKSLARGKRDGDVVTNGFTLSKSVSGDMIRFTFDRAAGDYVQYQLTELVALGAVHDADIRYEVKSASPDEEAGQSGVRVSFPYLQNEDGTAEKALLFCNAYDKKTHETKLLYMHEVALGESESVFIPSDKSIEGCTIEAFLLQPNQTVAKAENEGAIAAEIRLADSTMTVSGTLPDVDEPSDILLLALRPDCSFETLTAENFAEQADYFKKLTTADDGSFRYSYRLNGDGGVYEMNVIALADKLRYQAESNRYYTQDDLNRIAQNEFSAANAAEQFEALLETYTDILPTASIEERQSAAAYLLEEKKQNNGFADFVALDVSYRAALVFFKLQNAETTAEFEEILKANKTVFDYESLSAYNAYQNMLDATGRTEVLRAVMATDSDHISGYAAVFNEKTILTAVATMTNWRLMEDLLDQNRSLLTELDFEKYDALCDKDLNERVDKQIAGKSNIATLSDLCKAINKAMNESQTSGSGKQNGSSGSSSGGGGGGGKLLSTTPTVKDDTPQTPPASAHFSDMADTAWAVEAVEALYAKHIVNGKAANVFAPNDWVTREEFVKMLQLCLPGDEGENTPKFEDVNENDWYYAYIRLAYSRGLVQGISPAAFGVGQNITREDMAVLICRALETKRSLTVGDMIYTDEDAIASYAADSVKKLANYRIISGMEDGSFMPKKNASRAEAAVLLYRALQLWEGK